MTVSDAALVKEVLDGSKDAFAELVRRYQRPAMAAAQDAFGPWLLKIVRRCALDIADKKKPNISIAAAEQLPAHQGNGRLDDDKQHLLQLVMRLGKTEQQVVLLRYFGSHTVAQVAEITGRSVGTITKQLSRAHQSLRNKIKE